MTVTNMANYFRQSLNICRQNPFQFLMRMKYNIPDDLADNPEGIVQYLMNTGKMSQSQLQQIQAFKNQVESNFNNANTR